MNFNSKHLFYPAVLFAFAIACSSGPTKLATVEPIRTVSSTGDSNNTSLQPVARGCDGSDQLTGVERFAIVGAAVQAARAEIQNNPESIRDQNVRDRVGTFAAIWVDDKVPLIALDRSCWSEFAQAKKHLSDGEEAEAKESGEAWQICLEATFPDRVAIAKPYFSCFSPGLAKSKPPTEN